MVIKKTLIDDIEIEFSTNPRKEYTEKEIGDFAGWSLRRGELAAEDIVEALFKGIDKAMKKRNS